MEKALKIDKITIRERCNQYLKQDNNVAMDKAKQWMEILRNKNNKEIAD